MDWLARRWRQSGNPSIDLRPGRSPRQAVALQEGLSATGARSSSVFVALEEWDMRTKTHGSILVLGYSVIKVDQRAFRGSTKLAQRLRSP